MKVPTIFPIKYAIADVYKRQVYNGFSNRKPLNIMCTWQSMNPGNMNPPLAFTCLISPSGILTDFSLPISKIFSFFIRTIPFFIGFPPLPSMIVPLWIRKYTMCHHPPVNLLRIHESFYCIYMIFFIFNQISQT